MRSLMVDLDEPLVSAESQQYTQPRYQTVHNPQRPDRIGSSWVMFLRLPYMWPKVICPLIKLFIVLAILHEGFSQTKQGAKTLTKTETLLIRPLKQNSSLYNTVAWLWAHWQVYMRYGTGMETDTCVEWEIFNVYGMISCRVNMKAVEECWC